ncbi:MAG: hypothetical protein ACK5MV_08715 [Aminipila sp.]
MNVRNGQHYKYSVENFFRSEDKDNIKVNLERALLKLFCESMETKYKLKTNL